MAACLVAGSAVGGGHFHNVHRQLLSGAHGQFLPGDIPMDKTRPHCASISDNSSLHSQKRAFHGVLYFLRAPLPRNTRRSCRLALDLGTDCVLHRRLLLRSRRDPSSLRRQPPSLAVRFPSRFHRRVLRNGHPLVMVSRSSGERPNQFRGLVVPSVFSHAVSSVGISGCFYRPDVPKQVWLAGAFCSMIPDLDVVGSVSVSITAISGGTGDSHTPLPLQLCWRRRCSCCSFVPSCPMSADLRFGSICS
jgi:hypothetical protein